MPAGRKQKREATQSTAGEESKAKVQSTEGDMSIPETQGAIEATEGEALGVQVEDIQESQDETQSEPTAKKGSRVAVTITKDFS